MTITEPATELSSNCRNPCHCTRSSPGALPCDKYSRQASVVMVTRAAPQSSLVISASSRLTTQQVLLILVAIVKSNTYLVISFSLQQAYQTVRRDAPGSSSSVNRYGAR